MTPKITRILDYLYISFCNDVDIECNRLVHNLDSYLNKQRPEWLKETVPSYGTLAINVDRSRIASDEVLYHYIINAINNCSSVDIESRLWELPAIYGGEYGPDLAAVAREKGLTEDEVINIHSSKVYTCYMLGFTPGFVYLGDVDERIRVGRLPRPRLIVTEGSIGLAGKQTGFYGISGPGGWKIIGKLKVKTFDLGKNPPSLVKPGDKVKFLVESS